eukprot:scaffold70982_cov62-Attheya_sp.AAC.5
MMEIPVLFCTVTIWMHTSRMRALLLTLEGNAKCWLEEDGNLEKWEKGLNAPRRDTDLDESIPRGSNRKRCVDDFHNNLTNSADDMNDENEEMYLTP